jgi:membrane carboxypeptidase/penicillin-binding protein
MRAATKVGTSKISMRDIEQQVACKTGTSNGPKDVSIWCGSPEIFIGIRFGHDNYEKNIEVPVYMKKVSGDSDMLATGGWMVGPLARRIFDRIYANRPKVSFSDQVEVNTKILTDKYSGYK